jgi:hypothetical protein
MFTLSCKCKQFMPNNSKSKSEQLNFFSFPNREVVIKRGQFNILVRVEESIILRNKESIVFDD